MKSNEHTYVLGRPDPVKQSYTSFSGADVIAVFLPAGKAEYFYTTDIVDWEPYVYGGSHVGKLELAGGKRIGELSSIQISKSPGGVYGSFKFVVFDKSQFSELLGKSFDLVAYCINEYGRQGIFAILEAHLNIYNFGVSVDTIAMEEHFEFHAKDFLPLKSMKVPEKE